MHFVVSSISCFHPCSIKKSESVLKEELIQRRILFLGRVVYFGWPKQPSSGIMKNLNWTRLFMGNFFKLFVWKPRLRNLNETE